MAARSETSSATEFVMTREFDAPRALVFRAWSDPKQLVQWFGPRFFTNRFEGDLQPGGSYRLVMIGPDGVEYPMRGQYLEVVEPERLAYTQDLSEHPESWHDLVNPERDKAANEVLTTVTFEERGDRTRVTLHMRFASAAVRDRHVKLGMREGWAQSFDVLGELLMGDRAFVVTRTFDAPRELVYRAWTEAAGLERWWGPKEMTWVRASLDLRPGGLFHYCLRSPDGQALWGKFVYQEVVPPERLAFIVSFSDADGRTVRAPFSESWPLEVLSSVSFVEFGDKTVVLLAGVPVHASEAERQTFSDGHASMRQGWTGPLDQLAHYLSNEARR